MTPHVKNLEIRKNRRNIWKLIKNKNKNLDEGVAEFHEKGRLGTFERLGILETLRRLGKLSVANKAWKA